MAAFDGRINSRELERMFTRLLELSKSKKPMTEVVEFGVSEVQDTFKRAIDPYGVPWKPLSETTLLQRAKRAVGGKSLRRKRGGTKAAALKAIATAKPLLDTGRLRNSVNATATPDRGIISTSAEYASTHQFGAKRGEFGSFSLLRSRRVIQVPWGDVPARPFFPTREAGLPRHWRDEIEQILSRAIKAAF